MDAINVDELPEFDAADFLTSEEAIAAFLADAQQDGPAEVAKCQVIVERARKRWGLPKTGITSA